jgi:hypothetical protein
LENPDLAHFCPFLDIPPITVLWERCGPLPAQCSLSPPPRVYGFERINLTTLELLFPEYLSAWF